MSDTHIICQAAVSNQPAVWSQVGINIHCWWRLLIIIHQTDNNVKHNEKYTCARLLSSMTLNKISIYKIHLHMNERVRNCACNFSSCRILCWLKLVSLKSVSSRNVSMEVLVNVRGLIVDWMDCKDTSQSFQPAARRQTVIRGPLHLALTKRCSPVQPLYENKLLQHCWDWSGLDGSTEELVYLSKMTDQSWTHLGDLQIVTWIFESSNHWVFNWFASAH